MPLAIATCSKRKRLTPDTALHGRSLPSGTLDEVGGSWTRRLGEAQPKTSAERLYCGRSFSETSHAARAINGDLKIVSAGLGLISADRMVPSYSLTVNDADQDNVLSRIWGKPTSANWWRYLAAHSPFGEGGSLSQNQRSRKGDVTLMALPTNYLMMVADDLLSLDEFLLSHIRVFSGRVPKSLDPRLSRLLMPYDQRLNGPNSPLPGTATDFPARAMRHFAETVFQANPKGTLERHKQAVNDALRSWDRPKSLDRRRCTDDELVGLIHQNWAIAGSSSSRMLRKVRDDLGVACEQSRMKDLFAKVRGEKELS